MNGNLIIGSAFSYNVQQIEPFVKSLRKHYEEKVVLFVQNVDEETRDFYRHYRIDTYEIAETINYGMINVTRFEMYYRFLTSIDASECRKVLLVDTRDVIFQANPFANTDAAGLYLYAEPQMIGACATNSDWYKRLYGEEGLAKIERQLIICGGAILGTKDAIINLIEIFWAELIELTNNQKGFDKCDQPLLNYLAYSKLQDWVLGETYSSNVATLHHATYFTFNSDGRLLNTNGEPVPVVHQYDRRPWSQDLMLRQV